MNGQAGKGDRQRPRGISYREWSRRWDEAFGRDETKNETKKQKNPS